MIGSLKARKKRTETTGDMNKMINEMKKKIQLSEGQRKALFEECDTEQKNNSEKIEELKKEVVQLIQTLRNKTSNSAKDRVNIPQLNSIAAYLGEKTCVEIIQVLDLQVIDKVKKIDLIKHKIQQKEDYLKQLATEYQQLMSQIVKKEFTKKIQKPVTKNTFSLENKIHSIQVQWREANHIKNRYTDIRKALLTEISHFDAAIKNIENQLKLQEVEIEKLQKIGGEASRLKASVRSELVQEEKSSVISAQERERLEAEGKRLVAEGRQELEKLEKQIFLYGKTQKRQEEENPEDGQLDEEISSSPNPEQELIDTFNRLKETAGAKDAEETLEKFQMQKTTLARLVSLKATSENQKHKLEKKIIRLTNQLDALKFAEMKDAEQNSEEVEKIRNLIDVQKTRKHLKMESHQKLQSILLQIQNSLRGMFLNVNPKSCPTEMKDPQTMIDCIKTTLAPILNDKGIYELENFEDEEIEEKWFPPSYSSLLRRTPPTQPGQPGSATIVQTAASEEEDEVPTRDYLKKQAQMVVDSKSRKKVMRFSQRK